MRKEGWRGRLGEYVRSVRNEPYAMGKQDCWLFVSGAIKAMGGKNLSNKYKYKDAKSALSTMRAAGAKNMAEFAALHFEEIEPVNAQIGDVMAIPTKDAFKFSLGILNGEQVLVVSEKGVSARNRSEATRAFKV